MSSAQYSWKDIERLNSQILAAVDNKNWDEVSQLATTREKTVKHYVNYANHVQEADLHQKILLLLDFNKRMIKTLKNQQNIVIEKSNMLRQRRKAHASYSQTYHKTGIYS